MWLIACNLHHRLLLYEGHPIQRITYTYSPQQASSSLNLAAPPVSFAHTSEMATEHESPAILPTATDNYMTRYTIAM